MPHRHEHHRPRHQPGRPVFLALLSLPDTKKQRQKERKKERSNDMKSERHRNDDRKNDINMKNETVHKEG